MTRLILLAIVGAFAMAACEAAYCHGSPGPNAKPNMFPIYDGSNPKLLRTTKNGKAYWAGNENPFWLVHVWGTAYERGYAHGELMKEEASNMVNGMWEFMQEEIEGALPGWIPQWLADLIGEYGTEIALDLTHELTKNFTGEYFFDELHGLADAANVSYKKVRDIHLIGSLTQGDCSMYGAWGDATKDGKTYQLRALDWNTKGVFKNYPAVLVEHPSDQGHAWASVGFIGWIGGLTGQSETQLAISEIGVTFGDSTFGSESRVGIPFTYLLRDILQFDNSYEDSVHRIKTANRTCDLILGVGDGNAGTFRGFQYSYSVANVFDDKNMMPYNQTWHPRMKDVVYWGMDWLCPPYSEALASQLQQHYGKIDPAITIRNITSLVQTGSTHLAVYDLSEQEMYVSFLRPDNGTGPNFAYDRQFTKLALEPLWKESPPSA